MPSSSPVNTRSINGNRNWGIDCLRGLSILLVVLNHLGLGFRLPLKKSVLADFLPREILNAISFNGYEAVFIFFVISGFLISSRVLEKYGALDKLDWREFYLRRASRILPLLLILLVVLAILHTLGFSDYRIKAPGQSLGGATLSALGLYLNWYEGQTTWLPASWDVLWSLSIEEVFYLAFPIVCLLIPRMPLVVGLFALALTLPLSKGVLDGNEIWQEKAYLPGMSAIAIGVLCALAVQRWPKPPRVVAQCILAAGMAGLCLVLLFGPWLWKWIGHGNMWMLTFGAAAVVAGCKYLCTRDRAPTGANWLAGMGRLSYEIYLSHMFVVLAVVALYRSYIAELRWGVLAYIPCIVLVVLLGAAIEKWITLPSERKLRRRPVLPATATLSAR